MKRVAHAREEKIEASLEKAQEVLVALGIEERPVKVEIKGSYEGRSALKRAKSLVSELKGAASEQQKSMTSQQVQSSHSSFESDDTKDL